MTILWTQATANFRKMDNLSQKWPARSPYVLVVCEFIGISMFELQQASAGDVNESLKFERLMFYLLEDRLLMFAFVFWMLDQYKWDVHSYPSSFAIFLCFPTSCERWKDLYQSSCQLYTIICLYILSIHPITMDVFIILNGPVFTVGVFA